MNNSASSTGTGLGLSVSHTMITKNHGGEISVESAPGLGARFMIQLPVNTGTPGQAWLIYLTEKCQTYKLLVQYVVAVCHERVTKRGE